MFDSQYLSQQMINNVMKIDDIIMNKVVKVISADITKVAKDQVVRQLSKVNKALRMEEKVPDLRKVPSETDMFDLAGIVDVQGVPSTTSNLLRKEEQSAGTSRYS